MVQLFLRQTDYRRIILGKHLHLLRNCKTVQAQLLLAVRIVNACIYRILIDTLLYQFGYGYIHFGIVRIIGKISRIGHHSGINGISRIDRHLLEQSQTANYTEQDFTTRRYFRMRYRNIAKRRRIQVMIYQYFLCFRSHQNRLHRIDPFRFIEIQTENQIGSFYQFLSKVGITGINKYIFTAFQKTQAGWIWIGNNHINVLTQIGQRMP